MALPLNKKSQQLLDLLLTIPPNFVSAEVLLQQESFSSEEVTKTAICYAEECVMDIADTFRTSRDDRISFSGVMPPAGVIPDVHSTYVYEVVQFLLPFGLQPNGIYSDGSDEYNLLDSLKYIDNEYLAADAMALLMEHGGDPNLIVNSEDLFRHIDFDVWFDTVEQYMRWRFDALVHIWMVLLAYGGKIEDKAPAVQVFNEYDSDDLFDLRKLKDHRNYYVGLSTLNNQRTIHIFDKKTFWEVARA